MKEYLTISARIFPTVQQIEQFNKLSNIAKNIYNHFLLENEKLFKEKKKILELYETHKQLTILKKDKPDWQLLNSKCSQRVLKSLYSNYKSFYNLIKKDKTVKPPQEIKHNFFKTLIFNQSGWIIKENNIIEINKIELKYKSKVDITKVKIKEIAIINRKNKWLLSIVIEKELPNYKTKDHKILAIDLGLKRLATGIDSDEQLIKIPNKAKKIDKYFGKQIAKIQKKKSKCQKGSKRYRYLSKIISKKYHKKNSQKKQNLHIQVNKLLNMNYSIIVVGDLQVKKLMQLENNKHSKVSKSFGSSNIGMFMEILKYKALRKGTEVINVNEANTTQVNCLTGKKFPDRIELNDRIVKISKDIIIDRDLNSAINIYNRWYLQHIACLTGPLEISSVLMRYNLVKESPLL